MQYRPYGTLGYNISALGFGAMRLPHGEDGKVDSDRSAACIHRALELGVNYIDTAHVYGESEEIVGRAMEGRWDGVYVATKIPASLDRVPHDTWYQEIEGQLKRLRTDHIDFFHFHDLKEADFDQEVMPAGGLMDTARKAKEDGLIRHIVLSCHEKPEVMRRFLDSGCFEGILLQHNFMNRANEEIIAHAASLGMGVIVMGPVGGGQLAKATRQMTELQGGDTSLAARAIRFVLANPGVTCAISGMNSVDMVEENCVAASREEPLSDEEKQMIVRNVDEMKRLSDLYCTSCGYCMPCPHGVDISRNFQLMNQFRVYGYEETARQEYGKLGVRDASDSGTEENQPLRASECTDCGVCVEKCTQKIDIPKQLQEVAQTLAPTI